MKKSHHFSFPSSHVLLGVSNPKNSFNLSRRNPSMTFTCDVWLEFPDMCTLSIWKHKIRRICSEFFLCQCCIRSSGGISLFHICGLLSPDLKVAALRHIFLRPLKMEKLLMTVTPPIHPCLSQCTCWCQCSSPSKQAFAKQNWECCSCILRSNSDHMLNSLNLSIHFCRLAKVSQKKSNKLFCKFLRLICTRSQCGISSGWHLNILMVFRQNNSL